jgi:ribonucleoside-diphosphate reductase alpha chain
LSQSRVFKVQKRDGRIVDFDPGKVSIAIGKAFSAAHEKDGVKVSSLAKKVFAVMAKRGKDIVHVEDMQDIIEHVLISEGYERVAKAYILYRKHHSDIREAKELIGVIDDLKLSMNALQVLRKRYLRKNLDGRVVETPRQLFRRVAHHVALADRNFGDFDYVKSEEDFYALMSSLEFLPNSPTLMNAGTEIGQLSACFVLPVPDSVEGIFEALKDMALVHQSGGGTGFSFSDIRPKGDIVRSTRGVASGPVSFMRVFDSATEEIKQGGRRRGANMGILRVDHPDIIEFITAKEDPKSLLNFNISVAVTDKFMKAVENDKDYELKNPHTGKVAGSLRARDVFDLIVTMAWRSGDPGIIFIDEINKRNPTPVLGAIDATNPCGEQPLLPFESCNLGSINLAKMVREGRIDWSHLRDVVHTAVHFLDNVIEVNRYPVGEIERMTMSNRKIGLGVMGFADLLVSLGISYDSDSAVKVAEDIMKFIDTESKKASVMLARTRGSFPNFDRSIWKGSYPCLRNATTTTIAPTGTISIIAGCSSGIEPMFAVSFVRDVLDGSSLLEVSSAFEDIARRSGFYSHELSLKIARSGSLRGISGIPKNIKRLFVTALDVSAGWHIRLQSAFQRYTDSAVSKTINLDEFASKRDVERAFLLAHKMRCKGITVYRYGSKRDQVLRFAGDRSKKSGALQFVGADEEFSGGCPAGECPF